MPIQVQCDRCSSVLRVPDHASGKHVRCPKCQNVIPVSASDIKAQPVRPKANPEQLRPRSNDESSRVGDERSHPKRRNDNGTIASRFALQKWKTTAIAIVLVGIGTSSFWLGRFTPQAAIGGSSSQSAANTTVILDSETPDVAVSGDFASQLAELTKLEPVYAFGDEMQEIESQPDSGSRLQLPRFDNIDKGKHDGLLMMGNPSSEFILIEKAQYVVRVEERRGGRYRAAALLGSKPAAGSNTQRRILKIMAIAPSLDSQHSNAGWVFRHLDVETQLVAEDGTSINHPDESERERITQRITAGQAGPSEILGSLKKMRFPHSRKALFQSVASRSDLSESQRDMFLRLLGCPVVCGLFFDANVGPGGIMSDGINGAEIRAFAAAGLPEDMADLVVEAIMAETRTGSILNQKLHEKVFGPSPEEASRTDSLVSLPDAAYEALNSIWENASTDSLIRLLCELDDRDRSVQLRRLVRDRQLTETQITSILSSYSSADEVGVLLEKVPAPDRDRILNLAANELKNGHPTSSILLALLNHGLAANIIEAVRKAPKDQDLNDVIQKLSLRSDLTAADRQAIQELAAVKG